MTSITFLATVKSPLLPLVVLFVCLAQVLSLADPNKAHQANLKTIAQFRNEIVECNDKIRWIIRKDGKDVVASDPNRCTKRALTVAMTAHRNIADKVKYETFYRLLEKFKLIPALDFDQNIDDILKMNDDYLVKDCPFYKYYKSISDGVEEKKIKECADSKREDRQVSLLANYFVPLARRIISEYDEGISYITREYERLCIDPKGIVHQYPKYYLLVWRSMFEFWDFTNRIEFIATACPFVPINGAVVTTQDIADIRKNEVQIEAKDVDFRKEVEIPKRVVALWKFQFSDFSRYTERVDIVAVLEQWGRERYSYKPDNVRQELDDNVWLGYQKKLAVQLTMLRVMRDTLDAATLLVDDRKDKLQDWLRARTSSSGQIPHLITAAVHQVLSTSEQYRKSITKSNDILALVLKLAYGQENVHFEPNSVEQPLPEGFTSGLQREIKIDKVRMFFPQDSTLLLPLSRVTDSLVRSLKRFQIVSFDKFCTRINRKRYMIMVGIVFALEDIMDNLDVKMVDDPLLPLEQESKDPVNPGGKTEDPPLYNQEQVQVADEQLQPLPESKKTLSSTQNVQQDPPPSQPCYKSTCFRGTIGALIVAGTLYGAYWYFLYQPNDTVSDDYYPTSNSSIAYLSTQSPSGIHFWLMIVTIGLIFALLVIGSLFYLIRCRRRRRGNWLPTISILALTGCSLIAYYFLGNLNSKVTLVLCVGAFLVAIFMVGWAACVSKSNGEQHSIKPSKKSSSNLAATSSYLTNESSSGLGGSSSILSSSVAASSTAKSTAKVQPQVSSSSVIGGTISFGPTSVNQCLTKSILKATAEGPSRTQKQTSPTKGLMRTSLPARTKSPTGTAPSSTALLITLPKKKASFMKGPSQSAPPASRVKSPTGKVPQSPTGQDTTTTTKPGDGDPKEVHKKKK